MGFFTTDYNMKTWMNSVPSEHLENKVHLNLLTDVWELSKKTKNAHAHLFQDDVEF